MIKQLLFLLLISFETIAAPKIAVLDFELKDLTLAPGIPTEIQRTASIKPLLEAELRSGGYEIVTIPISAQNQANSGVGYLFDHPDGAGQSCRRRALAFHRTGLDALALERRARRRGLHAFGKTPVRIERYRQTHVSLCGLI